jgi:RHS repeat-associated protein
MSYNSGMETSRNYEEVRYFKNYHGPNMGSDSNLVVTQKPETAHQSPLTHRQNSTAINKTLSSTMIDTYYIWTHDGKLLAEYDHNGVCVKDYIYVGNKLLAEYHPQTGKYYYHLQDQINSTRIVTDDDGNVVYSAAHGPYGDIQKEWVNTYDPKQKFSGKERESYSGLDYFGARYYDSHSYRFISVDPIRNKQIAISNPQLWNLYLYCRNNPIRYLDPDGRQDFDWLADALAADYLDKNTDISYQEYTQLIDQCRGVGALAGFIGLSGYFAPEIAATLGPLTTQLGDKLFRFKKMLSDANSLFGKGGLTKAGRALSKHPNIVGVITPKAEAFKSLLDKFGSVPGINAAATSALINIMKNGNQIIRNHKEFGKIIDFVLPSGLGARFSQVTKEFIGWLGRGK